MSGRGVRARILALVLLVAVTVAVAVAVNAFSTRKTDAFEGGDDPASTATASSPVFLSALHVTPRRDTRTITVCLPPTSLPCDGTTAALQGMPVPLTPLLSTDPGARCALAADDLVSLWLLGPGGGFDVVVAACPGGDKVLTIVAVLGKGGIPRVPRSADGISLRDIAAAGATVTCAGHVEGRLVSDICKAANPPIVGLRISLADSASASTGEGPTAFFRPRGNADVASALALSGAVQVALPRMDSGIFALSQPLAKLDGQGGDATVSSTAVLVGPSSVDGDPWVLAVFDALTDPDPLWALGELNMASRHLPILPSTSDELRRIDTTALRRTAVAPVRDIGIPSASSSILQFDGFRGESGGEGGAAGERERGTLTTHVPVDGHLIRTAGNGLKRVFRASAPYIGAVLLREGDRVLLRDQPTSRHDGDYTVHAVHAGGATMVSWAEATYDAISFVDESGAMVVSAAALKDPARCALWPPSAYPLREGDLLLLRNLDDSRGTWTRVSAVDGRSGSTTVTFYVDPASTTVAAAGSCVTSTSTTIRSMCEASGNVWDSPCTADDQCPFFQANRTYVNYRGGCIDGWCEMPLGVKRVSYRRAVPGSTPICHGCDVGDRTCCDRQAGSPDVYPDGPDVAFPLDEYARARGRDSDRQIQNSNHD